MNSTHPLSINLNGTLLSLEKPIVMGILNVTPDSFYAASRCESEREIRKQAVQIVNEGATIIDIGAYSSRPNAQDISAEEEIARLDRALKWIRQELPHCYISVDTFRAAVARFCVEKHNVSLINDISAGELDPDMFTTVAQLRTPYILMHMQGTPQTMTMHTQYDNLLSDILHYFSKKIMQLRELGICDLIIDPGFGFSKTLDDNYKLIQSLPIFQKLDLPLLVGISRKSMIYKLLGNTPAESLNGTTVLNTLALTGGAHILRVHDVKEAVETVELVTKMQNA